MPDNQNREDTVKYLLAKIAEMPEQAEDRLKTREAPFKPIRTYVKLKKQADEFLEGKNTESRLIIMPGLRGVGKTTLLFQLYKHLREKGVEKNRLLYLSADDLKSYLGKNILDAADTFITEIHRASFPSLKKEIFIFIDEAHSDPEWSQTAKIIFDRSKKIFAVFTGSSALNLKLTTDTARRSDKIQVFPLGFGEYTKLKHDFYPPDKTAERIRQLIFTGTAAAVKKAQEKEAELTRKLVNIPNPLDKEIEDYLCHYGFPFGLHLKKTKIYPRIFSMVNRVIEKDIPSIKSFNTETGATISRIISILALQKPGETSDSKIASNLEISASSARDILETLEKTHLIFSVKPYGGTKKTAKSWKYYFLSPSINAAIRSSLGRYNQRDREMLGVLTETLAASYFFRMKETVHAPMGLFYDPKEGGADFLLQDGEGKIIPVEIGIGKKKAAQTKKSVSRYKSKHGIVISSSPKTDKKGSTIFLPLKTFLFA